MNQLENIYEGAMKAFEEGQFSEAEDLFLRLLKEHPERYADVYYKLGMIEYKKEAPGKAIEYFQKALQLNPRFTDVSLSLTIAYNDLGRYEEARETFFIAAKIVQSEQNKIDPFIQGKLANEHLKLGNIYFDTGMIDEALEQYSQALARRPRSVDILTRQGVACREKGLFDEGIDALTRAKRINPNYLPAIIHLGITYYAKGFTDLALREWEEAQQIDPDGTEAEVYLSLAKKEVVETT